MKRFLSVSICVNPCPEPFPSRTIFLWERPQPRQAQAVAAEAAFTKWVVEALRLSTLRTALPRSGRVIRRRRCLTESPRVPWTRAPGQSTPVAPALHLSGVRVAHGHAEPLPPALASPPAAGNAPRSCAAAFAGTPPWPRSSGRHE